MLAGQVSAPVSLTVTVKLQVANKFPDVSLVAQITLVAPTGKTDPDAGSQSTVPQLPNGVGAAAKITTLLHPLLVDSETSAGQARVQSFAATVTVKVQGVLLFEASVAVQLTVVVPVGKLVPEGGLQKTWTVCVQLSVAAGVE